MDSSAYARFDGTKLILRDELAIDRTLLANERTLLAYLRSGVALIIGGVSLFHFANGWLEYVGLACVPAGLVTGWIGIVRYRCMDRVISVVRTASQEAHVKASSEAPILKTE